MWTAITGSSPGGLAWRIGALAAMAVTAFLAGPEGLLIALGAVVVFIIAVAGLRTWESGGAPAGLASGDALDDPSSDRPWGFTDGLWGWLATGLVLRLGIAFLVNGTNLWLSFGPDAITWELRGQILLSAWEHPGWVPLESALYTFFPALNAASLLVFGEARFPIALLNCFVGVGAALLAGRYAEQVFGRESGRRACLLVLFFPSLMLWGAMSLRDVWAHAGVLVVLIAGHNARTRFAPLSLMSLLASLALLYFIRPYLLGLLLVAVAGSLMVVRPRQLPYALVALVAMVLFAQTFGDSLDIVSVGLEEQLTTIQKMREGLAYGGSAYGADVDTRDLKGAMAYLPIGVARFLFSPFPWEVRSWQQMIALPEALAFVVLAFQASRRAAGELVGGASRVALPISVFVALTTAYALVSGNEGTAFRHRGQVVPIALVFAAAHQVGARRRSADLAGGTGEGVAPG